MPQTEGEGGDVVGRGVQRRRLMDEEREEEENPVFMFIMNTVMSETKCRLP